MMTKPDSHGIQRVNQRGQRYPSSSLIMACSITHINITNVYKNHTIKSNLILRQKLKFTLTVSVNIHTVTVTCQPV